MDLDSRPIGIGNLTSLKKAFLPESKQSLTRVPTEATRKEEAAQLSVDVYETATDLYIVAPLGGVSEEELKVEITEDVVTIEGVRTHPLDIQSRDILIQECYFGAFSRSIVLPDAVDTRNARAAFKKNVLVISIPKLEDAKTRILRIERD